MHFREISGRQHMTFSEDVNNKINILKELILENGSYSIMRIKLKRKDVENYLNLRTSLLSTQCSMKGLLYPGGPNIRITRADKSSHAYTEV